jgi:hypothetical protein
MGEDRSSPVLLRESTQRSKTSLGAAILSLLGPSTSFSSTLHADIDQDKPFHLSARFLLAASIIRSPALLVNLHPHSKHQRRSQPTPITTKGQDGYTTAMAKREAVSALASLHKRQRTTAQPSITPTAPKRASLMGLPRELRDQVCHEVWKLKSDFEVALDEEPTTRRPKKQIAVVHYGAAGDELDPVAAQPAPRAAKSKIWFLANKQLCAEVIQQF